MSTPIPSNRAPFTVSEVVSATSGTVTRRVADSSVGVGTDTRQELRDALFVALRGEHFDAHDFLAQAVDAGARVLLVARGRGDQAPSGVTVIEVDDTLVALGQLARAHRLRWPGRVVAVAGSAGKTTTRSVISSSALRSASAVKSRLCRPWLIFSTQLLLLSLRSGWT